MKKISFPLIFLSVLIIFGCKKHNEELREIPNQITIGDADYMFIQQFDTILIGDYQKPVDFNIDMDKDGLDDIRLTSEIWGSPGMGLHPRSWISCMSDNVEFNGFYDIDTTFLSWHIDTTEGINYDVEIHYHYYYSCRQFNSTDSIFEINDNVFKFSTNNAGQTLNRNSTFDSDTLILNDHPYYTHNMIEISPDTLLVEHWGHLNNCKKFPLDEIKYIGIKITKNGIEMLGWVKIGVFDINHILVLESAIQR